MRYTGFPYLITSGNIRIYPSQAVPEQGEVPDYGYQARQNGYRIMYINTVRLMGRLKPTRAKETILHEHKKIEHIDLLIPEGVGLQSFDSEVRIALPNIIEDRHPRRSAIITSQTPIKEWYDVTCKNNLVQPLL